MANIDNYPIPNSQVMKRLKLQHNPEGGTCDLVHPFVAMRSHLIVFCMCNLQGSILGYFAETDRQREKIASPFAGTPSHSPSPLRCVSLLTFKLLIIFAMLLYPSTVPLMSPSTFDIVPYAPSCLHSYPHTHLIYIYGNCIAKLVLCLHGKLNCRCRRLSHASIFKRQWLNN